MLKNFFAKKEPVDLKSVLQNGAIVVDVRSEEEFKDGHVKGAVNIPLPLLESKLSLLKDKNSAIITCCLSGGRSTMAINILKSHGYTQLYNGGGWRDLDRVV